jgi:hypothetical protein
MEPSERAAHTTRRVERFYTQVFAPQLFAEVKLSESPANGDLIVGSSVPLAIELKMTGTHHSFYIPIDQMQSFSDQGYDFSMAGAGYMLCRYIDKLRDPRRPGSRNSFMYPLRRRRKCEGDFQQTLALLTREIFFIHPHVVKGFYDKFGFVERRDVYWGNSVVCVPKKSFLYPLRDEPHTTLSSIGVNPKGWRVSSGMFEIPWCRDVSIEGQQPLPLLIRTRITHCWPHDVPCPSQYFASHVKEVT